MDSEKKLKIAETIAVISLSLMVISFGVAYYFYNQFNHEKQRAEQLELEHSVSGGHQTSLQYNLTKKLNLADSVIAFVLHPDTKRIKVENTGGIFLQNNTLQTSYVKIENAGNGSKFYQVILSNKTMKDTLQNMLPVGDFERIPFKDGMERASVIWK